MKGPVKDGALLLLAAVIVTAIGLIFFRISGEHSFAILFGMAVVGLLLGGTLKLGRKK